MNGSHSVHEVRGRRRRFLKSGCVKWTQRKSNLVQRRSVGLKACGLKSGLDRHLKQTGVLVKGVKREEQGDFDHCYLNARVDEKKTYPRQKRWVVCLRQRSCLPVVCSGAAVWVIIAVGGADVNMYPAVFIKNIILSCIILLSHLILYKEDAVVLMYSFTYTNGLQESTGSY